MKEFKDLTSRGMALRIRELAIEALQEYDLDVKKVRLIQNSYNGIFRVDTHVGEKYVIRINVPGERSREEIHSEMMWLDALHRDTDLGIPYPVRTRDGKLLTTVALESVPNERHCVVFSWIPGYNLANKMTPENFFKVGQLSAHLHEHAQVFKPLQSFWLKVYDKVFPNKFPVKIYDEGYRDLISEERLSVFKRAEEKVAIVLSDLFDSDRAAHVIHADLHHGNIKVSRGNLYALDFDDTMIGFPVQDVAISFYYFQQNPGFPELRQAFERGYTSLRNWPEEYPGQIDTLIAGRALVLVNFLLQHPDPRFQQILPRFLESEVTRLRRLLKLGS
jgi:Ser/Thr protein kinase RdoA (MazF antagonist)